MAQAINLVEMEERLAGDAAGTYRDQIVARFNNQLQDLKRQIDAGLAPADFEVAQKLNSALTAAVAVVDKVWQRLHKVA
jgi:type III secretion system YseE family protein